MRWVLTKKQRKGDSPYAFVIILFSQVLDSSSTLVNYGVGSDSTSLESPWTLCIKDMGDDKSGDVHPKLNQSL